MVNTKQSTGSAVTRRLEAPRTGTSSSDRIRSTAQRSCLRPDSAAHGTLLNETEKQQLQRHIIDTLCLQIRRRTMHR